MARYHYLREVPGQYWLWGKINFGELLEAFGVSTASIFTKGGWTQVCGGLRVKGHS